MSKTYSELALLVARVQEWEKAENFTTTISQSIQLRYPDLASRTKNLTSIFSETTIKSLFDLKRILKQFERKITQTLLSPSNDRIRPSKKTDGPSWLIPSTQLLQERLELLTLAANRLPLFTEPIATFKKKLACFQSASQLANNRPTLDELFDLFRESAPLFITRKNQHPFDYLMDNGRWNDLEIDFKGLISLTYYLFGRNIDEAITQFLTCIGLAYLQNLTDEFQEDFYQLIKQINPSNNELVQGMNTLFLRGPQPEDFETDDFIRVAVCFVEDLDVRDQMYYQMALACAHNPTRSRCFIDEILDKTPAEWIEGVRVLDLDRTGRCGSMACNRPLKYFGTAGIRQIF